MRKNWAVGATLLALPLLGYAEEATVQEVHDKPAVRGSIIANMLQEHDNPFTLYPYEPNFLIYTDTSNINKKAIESYDWADKARHDEVEFQLSLAFPLWRGIAGDNSVLGASYTQKSFWQLSNSGQSSPFRETNYEPQLFLARGSCPSVYRPAFPAPPGGRPCGSGSSSSSRFPGWPGAD